jgi:hypothetical protein
MIARRAVVGLSLLSALAFCAFAAQSASAAKSTFTTLYTCVPVVKTGDFVDEHCDTTGVPGKENFAHKVIPTKTTTEIEAKNIGVTSGTKETEPAVLKSKLLGVKVTIECTVVENEQKKTFLHNEETEVEGKKVHTVTGEVVTLFKTCNVKELAKCAVKEPIVSEANVEGVEKLGAKEEDMGLNFVGKGAEEAFAPITFENKGAEKCALAGKTFTVKGSAIGTNGPGTEASQKNTESGATLVFTPKEEMQKLKLGPETAEFSTIVTPRMGEKEGKTEPPISMTTIKT